MSADGHTQFVIDEAVGRIRAIDRSTHQMRWEVTVASGLRGTALSLDGRQILACSGRAGEITVIDIAEARIVGHLRMNSAAPRHCVFSPDRRWVVVSPATQTTLEVVELDSGRVRHRIPLPATPSKLVFDKHQLRVAFPDVGKVEVIDTRGWHRRHGVVGP
jgi:WD40 repeat protein